MCANRNTTTTVLGIPKERLKLMRAHHARRSGVTQAGKMVENPLESWGSPNSDKVKVVVLPVSIWAHMWA